MAAAAHVLILAGSRGGIDPVAAAAGVSHKALAPVAGVPMLARVVATLRAALPGTPIVVAIDRSPPIDRLLADIGDVTVLPPDVSPAATVQAAWSRFAAPFLVATGDHPLLSGEMVRHFLDAVPADADAAVAVARRAVLESRYQSRRTYWRFGDTEVSGCNLFYLGAGAENAIAFWRTLEADRKHPLKVLRRLGLWTVFLFGCGLLDLTAAVTRLGRATRTRLAAVEMPFAEAAIDVDRPDDLRLAERILGERPS